MYLHLVLNIREVLHEWAYDKCEKNNYLCLIRRIVNLKSMIRIREYKDISLSCPAQLYVFRIADGSLYINKRILN
jgi:hypothetical protein